jgi:phosphatidylinositol-3-phosphatase
MLVITHNCVKHRTAPAARRERRPVASNAVSTPSRPWRPLGPTIVGTAVAAACALALLIATRSTSHARPHAAAGVARRSASAPCGRRRRPPARYDHVLWITFENQSAKHVIGGGPMPFLNRLARRCGLATNFFAEAHPSLPNYIAMTSGGTQGVTGDSSGPLGADSIYAQVRRSGRRWRHYAFGMPSNCDPRDSPSSDRAIYTAHHAPPVFYRSIAADCARWDVGVGDPAKVEDRNDVRSGPLARALDTNTLPAFATIEPTDDGGDSKAGGEVDPVKGDAFLARWIPRITASRAYRSGRTAILITWDEPDDFGTNPPRDTIATIVVAPTVPRGDRVATRFDHYSMLRTTEEMLGLRPFLGAAANARSMRRGFHF